MLFKSDIKPSLSAISLHAGNTNEDTQPTSAQVLDKGTSERVEDRQSHGFYVKFNHRLRPHFLPTYIPDGVLETKSSHAVLEMRNCGSEGVKNLAQRAGLGSATMSVT